jgi:Tfp pilus assembly protein PilZ
MSKRLPRVEIRLSAGNAASAAPTVDCTVDDQRATVDLADVSVLGAFVQHGEPLPIDSEVAVALRFSDATFAMRAHVVQCVPKERASAENRKPGFALLFEHIDEQERARLRKRVDKALALRAASQRPTATVTPKPSKPPKTSTLTAASPTPEVSAEERSMLDKLQGELKTLAGKPPWETLGISQGATSDEARAAFFAASKRYHPHLFSRYQMPDIKRVVTDLFITHKRAYDSMLRKPTARQTQPIQVSVRPPAERSRTPVPVVAPSPVPPRHSPLPAAGAADRRAARASADLTAALGMLRPPPEPKFQGPDAGRFVHDAMRHLSQNRFDQAETCLEKALSLDPLSANARVWLLVTQARKAKADGKLEDSATKYREVLVLDPKHHEALTETKKAQPAGGSGGRLLSRFFGGGNQEK